MSINITDTTNDQIAELILSQTYEERIDLSEYLSSCAKDWLSGGGEAQDLDASYFATLLAGWAENVQANAEPSP